MRSTILLSTLFCGMTGCAANSHAASPTIKEPIDSIVIIKHLRQMEVYNHGGLLKAYHVCLGPAPVGPKHFRNDGKTPEGIYHIDGKNPNSHYHKALAVSYPSAGDMAYAKRFGKPAGGDIKIHGLPNGYGHLVKEYIKEDWTLGCIALTDNEIDEVYSRVAVGICVNILP
jgi:murein L,D-transpeptidase YafK